MSARWGSKRDQMALKILLALIVEPNNRPTLKLLVLRAYMIADLALEVSKFSVEDVLNDYHKES